MWTGAWHNPTCGIARLVAAESCPHPLKAQALEMERTLVPGAATREADRGAAHPLPISSLSAGGKYSN